MYVAFNKSHSKIFVPRSRFIQDLRFSPQSFIKINGHIFEGIKHNLFGSSKKKKANRASKKGRLEF